MTIPELNSYLKDYDQEVFKKLALVLEKISLKSKALASNLKECFIKMQEMDRYLRAYEGKNFALKENEMQGEEFMIFRKYVRLLRSCTIMVGQDVSLEFKRLFIDFTFGQRIELAKNYGTCKN